MARIIRLFLFFRRDPKGPKHCDLRDELYPFGYIYDFLSGLSHLKVAFMTHRFSSIRVHFSFSIFAWTLGLCLTWRAQAQGLDKNIQGLLKDLVDINSASSNREGLELVRKRLQPAFESLGMRTTVHEGKNGHKVITFQSGQRPQVMFLGHIDTVFTPGKASPAWDVSDTEIRGAGVIDMKGGIVLMYQVLQQLKAKEGQRGLEPFMVVLNDDEETGSAGSKEIIRELADQVEAVLIFEPGLADGGLISAHSGMDWMRLVVKGRAAHAGLEPEKGRNACVELAAKILAIQKLNRFQDRLSVSPDVIEGGTTPNTICEQASVRIDARYPSLVYRDRVRQEMEAIRKNVFSANIPEAHDFSAQLLFEVTTDPMGPERTQDLTQEFLTLARKNGYKLSAQPVGYLSDGNHLTDKKVKLLVGVGPYGGGMHSQSEFMSTASFEQRSRLLQTFLQPWITKGQR